MSPYERRMWFWAWSVRSRLDSKRANLDKMLSAPRQRNAPPPAALQASSFSLDSSLARGTSGNDAEPASGQNSIV